MTRAEPNCLVSFLLPLHLTFATQTSLSPHPPCLLGLSFHNVYGPFGTWKGGREKAPAAFCRKVRTSRAVSSTLLVVVVLLLLVLTSPWHAGPVSFQAAASTVDFEVWGDGEQTRSFMYIDDCVEGILRIMMSDYELPLNLGTEEMVSMNEFAEIAMSFDGKNLPIRHIPGPQGVRGRNSDNTLIRQTLQWAPSTTIREGLREVRWLHPASSFFAPILILFRSAIFTDVFLDQGPDRKGPPPRHHDRLCVFKGGGPDDRVAGHPLQHGRQIVNVHTHAPWSWRMSPKHVNHDLKVCRTKNKEQRQRQSGFDVNFFFRGRGAGFG